MGRRAGETGEGEREGERERGTSRGDLEFEEFEEFEVILGLGL